MIPRRAGSLKLFSAFGIDVYVHWSWFLVAWFFYLNSQSMGGPGWFVATYASLFAIVLMHEFGHALACRSVGGHANLIVLWPLGGVAYVEPPQRPGAMLWSIAAGPLVNVVLVPITLSLLFLAGAMTSGPGGATGTSAIVGGGGQATADVVRYLDLVAMMNLVLLVFNILPIYPLDGGKILQSILWFFLGWARALQVAATIGLVVGIGAAGALLVSGALTDRRWFLILLAVFIIWQAWIGRETAKRMVKQEAESKQNLERRAREIAEPFRRRADER